MPISSKTPLRIGKFTSHKFSHTHTLSLSVRMARLPLERVFTRSIGPAGALEEELGKRAQVIGSHEHRMRQWQLAQNRARHVRFSHRVPAHRPKSPFQSQRADATWAGQDKQQRRAAAMAAAMAGNSTVENLQLRSGQKQPIGLLAAAEEHAVAATAAATAAAAAAAALPTAPSGLVVCGPKSI